MNRVERIFCIAELFFPVFLKINEDQLADRTGVCIAAVLYEQPDVPPFRLQEIIGNLSEEKQKEKKDFAVEKVNRLIKNEEYSSFESADDEKGQYGGGIKVNDSLYISVSGFPPDLDQEFVILVAMMAGELKLENYTRIQILSEKAVAKIKGE